MINERSKTAENDKWNVTELYENLEQWQQEFDRVCPQKAAPFFPQLLTFKGELDKGPELILTFLTKSLELYRALIKLFIWAHLRHDEDISHEEYKVAYNQSLAFLQNFDLEISWFEPELLALSQTKLDEILHAEKLHSYHFYLEKIVRRKPHTLSSQEEELLAMAQKPLTVIGKTFSVINDADLDFGVAEDSLGVKRPLTHAQYGLYIRDSDRILRESSFKAMLSKYSSFENTFCELINGQVEKNIFNSKARRFSSSLEAALFPSNISKEVYQSLINAVHKFLPAHHKYMELRKKLLKLEELHFWDVYVPITADVDIKMDFEEASQSVLDSVAPLGKEYQQKLSMGLLEQRWVDRYENKNKRSGAYSSGCYDSFPYILMNFKGTLRDAFTLAHEAGHSMHSLYSNQSQPFHYSEYSLFLAEVASTFNEELLMRYLLKKVKKPEEKIFLINQKIEDIRTTLFRQVMFAEFELWIHEQAEKGVALTPAVLKKRYKELNSTYFGAAVTLDELIAVEWARIPHFYYNFYVYQYATGISAALALSEKVLQGEEEAQKNYLNFLSLGSSCHPLEALDVAGVDMRSGAAVESALTYFSQLVDELEGLTLKK